MCSFRSAPFLGLMVPFFGCFDPGDPAATTMGDPLTSTSSFSSTDGASDTFTEHSSTAADAWSSTMTEEAGPAGGESGSSSESTMGVEESSDGTTVASSSTSDVPDESSGNSGAPDDTTGEPFRCAINSRFTEVLPLQYSATNQDRVNSVSLDGLSILMRRCEDGVYEGCPFYRGTRNSTSDPFGPLVREPSLEGIDVDRRDGYPFAYVAGTTDSTAYVVGTTHGFYSVFASKRDDVGEPYSSPPEPLSELGAARFFHVLESVDGERLYVSLRDFATDGGILVAERSSDGFGEATEFALFGAPVMRFAISSNERFLAYGVYGDDVEPGIWMAERRNASEPFGSPVHSLELDGRTPLWISDDGCELLMISLGGELVTASKPPA